MSFHPDVELEANGLLEALVGEGRAFTSLSLKMELRECLGNVIPIIQADVSLWLRTWFSNSGSKDRYISKDNGTYITYLPGPDWQLQRSDFED